MLKVSSFPCMPQAAMHLMALVKKEDVPVAGIEKIMRNDFRPADFSKTGEGT